MEVQFTKDDLLEHILPVSNLYKAYKQVVSNKSCGGVEGLQTTNLRGWLFLYKEGLIPSIKEGRFRPNRSCHDASLSAIRRLFDPVQE